MMDAFDVVRGWFAALTREDLEALVAFYHDNCVNEQGEQAWHGREGQRQLYGHAFATLSGGFDGGLRRKVRSIGRIELGAIQAEWTGRERRYDTGEAVQSAGYDEFTIEEGLIRHQRSLPTPIESLPDDALQSAERPRASSRYPTAPIVGVGAVIFQDGNVVLIKRRYEPLAGRWSLPGGRLELGEMLEAGVAREMFEETGLEIEVGPVIEVFDRILLDQEHRVRFHYVLIDYLCRPLGGVLRAGSDVDAAIWVAPSDLARYQVTAKVHAVIERGLQLATEHPWPVLKPLR
jgi:8-oxo-dGTP diphosphatase